MNIKKTARPLNKAKNIFVQWLRKKKAIDIDVYKGTVPDWDYYQVVSAFIDKRFYNVYFTMWKGVVKIDYSDEENKYYNMSLDDFLQLLS